MSTTATQTRSIAHVVFSQSAALVPNFALSPAEQMLALGIGAEDFADRAHSLVESDRERLDAEASVYEPLPNYCDTPGADIRAYKFELGLLFQAMRRAGMDESKRHEGARKYLQLATLTSWKQMSPELMSRLRFAINSGFLNTEWELAGRHESAVESRELPGIDAEDFARIMAA